MWHLSAFADEYDPDAERQLEGLKESGIGMIEPRGLFGKNIAELSEKEALCFASMLASAQIGVSAIGSPIGKIPINAPLEPELDRLRRIAQTAHILGTKRIRMFSFFVQPEQCAEVRAEVLKRVERMVCVAEEEKVLLCHENEKGIWGDTAQRNLELWREMGGALALVFDPANLIDVGEEPFPYAYEIMRDAVEYFHIKDSLGDCRFVPAGKGACRIDEMLRQIQRDRPGKDVILTLEPHLKIFDGMASLEQDMSKIKPEDNAYPDARAAFLAAAEALKAILPPVNE